MGVLRTQIAALAETRSYSTNSEAREEATEGAKATYGDSAALLKVGSPPRSPSLATDTASCTAKESQPHVLVSRLRCLGCFVRAEWPGCPPSLSLPLSLSPHTHPQPLAVPRTAQPSQGGACAGVVRRTGVGAAPPVSDTHRMARLRLSPPSVLSFTHSLSLSLSLCVCVCVCVCACVCLCLSPYLSLHHTHTRAHTHCVSPWTLLGIGQAKGRKFCGRAWLPRAPLRSEHAAAGSRPRPRFQRRGRLAGLARPSLARRGLGLQRIHCNLRQTPPICFHEQAQTPTKCMAPRQREERGVCVTL